MKTKLLKKIRRRFAYYWKKNGVPILIDKINREMYIIDKDFLITNGYRKEEDCELTKRQRKKKDIVDNNIASNRILKFMIFREFGFKKAESMIRESRVNWFKTHK